MRIRCTYYGCNNWATNAYCHEHSALRDTGGGGMLVLLTGVFIGGLLSSLGWVIFT